MLIYLASPYSHPDPAVRQQRFELTCDAAAALIRGGSLIFSPIAHCHPITERNDIPSDFAYWQQYDEEMIAACGALIVLQLPGWDQSVGVRAEIAIAERLGKPVSYLEHRP